MLREYNEEKEKNSETSAEYERNGIETTEDSDW